MMSYQNLLKQKLHKLLNKLPVFMLYNVLEDRHVFGPRIPGDPLEIDERMDLSGVSSSHFCALEKSDGLIRTDQGQITTGWYSYR